MAMQRIIWVTIFSALLLLSCEETIVLDLNQTQPRIIVEGLVSNQDGRQFVKVTRSVGFYDAGKPTPITTATVSVRDDLGNAFAFAHNPTGESKLAGYYYPVANFTGVIGRTYYLDLQVDNQTYQAQDQLMAVTTFDSIGYRLNEDQLEEPEEEGKIYELLLYAKEPQQSKDYYLFKFYRNDSLKVTNENEIYFTDDVLLGERIDGLPSPVFFGEQDTARIEMISLSRNGYLFYSDLVNLINNDGGMFGPPPANPRTNLTNGALGFFQASAIEADTLLIVKK